MQNICQRLYAQGQARTLAIQVLGAAVRARESSGNAIRGREVIRSGRGILTPAPEPRSNRLVPEFRRCRAVPCTEASPGTVSLGQTTVRGQSDGKAFTRRATT